MCIKIHQYLVPPNPRFCDLFLGLWQWSMWINLRAFDTHPLVWSRRRARQWKVRFFRAPKKQHGSGHVRTVYQAYIYSVNQDPRFFSTSLNYCLGNLGKLCQGEDRWCSSQPFFHYWFTMFPWRKETIFGSCAGSTLIQVLVELRLVIIQLNRTEILPFWTRFATKWCLHQLPLQYFFFRKDRKLSSTIKNLPKVRTSEPVPSDGQMVPVPGKPSCGPGMRFLVWDCGWKMLEEKGP